MPVYSFLCDKEEDGCNKRFQKTLSFTEYDEKVIHNRVTCPNCKKRKPVIVELNTPLHVGVSGRTVGVIAERNDTRISKDEKHHLHKKNNAYREPLIDKPLPDGMTRGRDLVK